MPTDNAPGTFIIDARAMTPVALSRMPVFGVMTTWPALLAVVVRVTTVVLVAMTLAIWRAALPAPVTVTGVGQCASAAASQCKAGES